MARMFGNDECPSGNLGDSLHLTNWILDYGAPCHMTPEVSGFIPGSLEDTDNTEMLEDISERSKFRTNVNRREACYKICDRIKQGKSEWKRALKDTRNMGKVSQKVFKTVVKKICKIYHIWVNLVHNFPISF